MFDQGSDPLDQKEETEVSKSNYERGQVGRDCRIPRHPLIPRATNLLGPRDFFVGTALQPNTTAYFVGYDSLLVSSLISVREKRRIPDRHWKEHPQA